MVLDELMFPSHPHAGAWHEAAVKYMVNTLSSAADLRDTSMVDGRTVNQWVRGANLQPDFTGPRTGPGEHDQRRLTPFSLSLIHI